MNGNGKRTRGAFLLLAGAGTVLLAIVALLGTPARADHANPDMGTVLSGIAGGMIGSMIGKGTGRSVAIGVGSALGALYGSGTFLQHRPHGSRAHRDPYSRHARRPVVVQHHYPPPVYVQPAPVYVQPPPVHVAPPPTAGTSVTVSSVHRPSARVRDRRPAPFVSCRRLSGGLSAVYECQDVHGNVTLLY